MIKTNHQKRLHYDCQIDTHNAKMQTNVHLQTQNSKQVSLFSNNIHNTSPQDSIQNENTRGYC